MSDIEAIRVLFLWRDHRDLSKAVWALKKGRGSHVDSKWLETVLKLYPELRSKL